MFHHYLLQRVQNVTEWIQLNKHAVQIVDLVRTKSNADQLLNVKKPQNVHQIRQYVQIKWTSRTERRARTVTDENQVVQMENVKIDVIVYLIWIQSDLIIQTDWQFVYVGTIKRSGCALDAAKVAKIKRRE